MFNDSQQSDHYSASGATNAHAAPVDFIQFIPEAHSMAGLSPEERLAAVEANQQHVERAILATNENIKELTQTVGILSKGLAVIAEALKHPPRDHCFLLDDVAEIKDWQKKVDTSMTTLKERGDKFEGGVKVILALIGGGNLLTIIAIIGTLVWIAQHMPAPSVAK